MVPSPISAKSQRVETKPSTKIAVTNVDGGSDDDEDILDLKSLRIKNKDRERNQRKLQQKQLK